MRSVLSLLDEASKLCGSDAKLARRIGVPGHHPNEWRAGKRHISPVTVGLLADVMQLDGEEARRLAAEAIVSNPKNAERREVLRRAFFVSLATGGAVLCGFLLTEKLDGEEAGRGLTGDQSIHRALSLALVLALAQVVCWLRSLGTGRPRTPRGLALLFHSVYQRAQPVNPKPSGWLRQG